MGRREIERDVERCKGIGKEVRKRGKDGEESSSKSKKRVKIFLLDYRPILFIY